MVLRGRHRGDRRQPPPRPAVGGDAARARARGAARRQRSGTPGIERRLARRRRGRRARPSRHADRHDRRRRRRLGVRRRATRQLENHFDAPGGRRGAARTASARRCGRARRPATTRSTSPCEHPLGFARVSVSTAKFREIVSGAQRDVLVAGLIALVGRADHRLRLLAQRLAARSSSCATSRRRSPPVSSSAGRRSPRRAKSATSRSRCIA